MTAVIKKSTKKREEMKKTDEELIIEFCKCVNEKKCPTSEKSTGYPYGFHVISDFPDYDSSPVPHVTEPNTLLLMALPIAVVVMLLQRVARK